MSEQAQGSQSTFEEMIQDIIHEDFIAQRRVHAGFLLYEHGRLQRDVADKDRRIASLEADATETALEKKALQAQINRVRALAEVKRKERLATRLEIAELVHSTILQNRDIALHDILTELWKDVLNTEKPVAELRAEQGAKS